VKYGFFWVPWTEASPKHKHIRRFTVFLVKMSAVKTWKSRKPYNNKRFQVSQRGTWTENCGKQTKSENSSAPKGHLRLFPFKCPSGTPTLPWGKQCAPAVCSKPRREYPRGSCKIRGSSWPTIAWTAWYDAHDRQLPCVRLNIPLAFKTISLERGLDSSGFPGSSIPPEPGKGLGTGHRGGGG